MFWTAVRFCFDVLTLNTRQRRNIQIPHPWTPKAQTLNPDAPARDLHARILEVTSQDVDDLPTTVALKIINDEVKKVLAYGSM